MVTYLFIIQNKKKKELEQNIIVQAYYNKLDLEKKLYINLV